MAGEWIKFESNLPEKPETLAITTAMGWDDPDLTVGKLMRLFRWFDQHTVNGNARGVTPASLNRIIGVAGFAEAVSDAGWLVIDRGGVSLEKFDRHNGATAKSRAQTAKRVANHRGKTEGNEPETPLVLVGNAPTVTPALAREEKRERRSNTPLSPQGGCARFEEFWNAWPKSERKQDKVKCAKRWKQENLDACAEAILADIETKRRSRKWQEEGGQFIEAPQVYLTGRRWEDGAEAGDSRPTQLLGAV